MIYESQRGKNMNGKTCVWLVKCEALRVISCCLKCTSVRGGNF